MSNLPDRFNEFSEARKNGFIKAKELKDQGNHIIGTFCTYTPNELMYAAGLYPVSLCGMSEEPIPDAEKHLPKNLCPLIKSSYGFAITDKCPYPYFADMIIGETTCDGKKKMYELLGKIKNVHVMQLPQVQNSLTSLAMWKSEILHLKDVLEKEFQVEITEEKLREAIKIKNEERRLLRSLYELGKLQPPAISGYNMYKVLESTQFTFDKHEQNENIKDTVEKIKAEYESGVRPVSKDAKRILITGCPMGGVVDKIVKTIEENEGVVVCFENCGGIKEKMKLVDETKDPIDAIAEKYLSIGCSVMTPNDERLKLISQLVDEYKVEGVIDVVLQACHTYSVETKTVKELVAKEKRIPYMAIETDYSQSDIGQVKTRISAFIEML